MRFSNEQLRVLENLAVAYDEWIQAERALHDVGGRPAWKTVAGKDYLYLISDRRGNAVSLGPRSADTEARFAQLYETRHAAKQRSRSIKTRFEQLASIYRALRLPRIADAAARVLVEADRRSLLGKHLLVVGTNALAAYELEAMERFASGLDATEDCDLTWASESKLAMQASKPLLDVLKAVDSTYTVNAERSFQARNAQAYEVEFLLPESLSHTFPASEPIRPIPLPEQDWLLLGQPVSQVVTSQRGIVARLVVPDPRYFALHKHWLAQQPKRNSRKRDKDRQQSVALWAAIRRAMPRFPIDRDFVARLPNILQPVAQQLDNS